MAFILDVNLRIKDIIGVEKVNAALAKVQGGAAVGGGTGVGGKGGTTAVTTGAKAQAATMIASAAAINKVTVSTNKLSAAQKKLGPSLGKVTASTKKASKSAETFGQKMKLAGVRYAAFVAATAGPLAIIGTLGKATAAVIEFDTAVLKLRQITGQTNEQIGGMRNQILEMATSTGTAASEIARVAKVLAQAGQRGDVLTESLTALAKVPLTPSFETIDAAIEGTIAALNQFNTEGLTTTEVLDVMTALSNNFAASSEDIAKGISRGGAAFEAIGGTFKEFAAIFTTIRQATRESAETVGTFMKTISSRLADPKIVGFLEGKGIRISESIEAGDPVGAIKEIAAALKDITSVQERVEIGTKLGGRRQISRLLALISNIDVLDETLATAGASAGAFGKIAEEGLAGLQAQLNIMVQEFNKLVQTLAEPLFIPIIKGVTTAGKAFVSMITVIKPIIPLLSQMIGFAVGFKLLAISISAAAKALAFLSTASISGGLPALFGATAGGGQAGGIARQRIQQRLQGGVGGAAAAAGGVAVGGFGARVGEGAKKFGQSQIGQLAMVAGVVLAASTLEETFTEAGNSAGIMASSFVSATAVLLGAVSLLSGKSVVGAITSFIGVMTPLGAAFAAAIAALGIFAFAAKKAVDVDVQSIIDAAKKRVSDIKVRPIDDQEALQKVTSSIGEEAVKGLEDSVERFSEGFSGLMASTIARLGNLFTGEGLITINDADAQKIIDDIIGENPKLLNEILRSAVEEFGEGGFLKGIEQTFAKSSKISVGFAKGLRSSMIKALGGFEKVISTIDQVQKDIKANKLAAAISKASADFAKLHVPTALTGELVLLSDAVGRAAKAINLNAQTFDKISQVVSQEISIIAPPTEFTREAAEKTMILPDLGGFMDPKQFEKLTGMTSETLQINKLLDNFFKSLVASRAKADELRTLLETPLIDPVDIINPFVNEFLKASDVDISPEAKQVFVAAATQLATQLRDGAIDAMGAAGDDDSSIDAEIKQQLANILGPQNRLSEAAITTFQQWLNAQALQAAKGLEGYKLLIEADLDTATRPKTLVKSLRQALERLDLDLGTMGLQDVGDSLGVLGGEFILGDMSNALLDLVDDTGPATKALQGFGDAFNKQSDLWRKVTEATLSGTGASADLSEQLTQASRDVGDFDVVLSRISEAARRAPQIVAEQGGNEEAVKAQQRMSDIILEQVDRTRRFIKAQAAIDYGEVFKTPAKIFAEALAESTAAVKIFTMALTTKDLQAGAGALGLERTLGGEVTTSRAPVPEAQVQTETVARTTANLQKALFGAGIGDTFENLRVAAIELARSTASRQQFGTREEFDQSQSNLKLVSALEDFRGSVDAIPTLIASFGDTGLDLEELAKLTATLNIEQAGELGAGELEKMVAEQKNITGVAKNIQAILENPDVARNPELIADNLSDSLMRAVEVLSTPKEQPQETREGIPRSFEQLKTSATEIGNAAATSERAAQESVRATEEMKSAATSMATSAEQSASILDLQREVLMGPPSPEAGGVVDEGVREAMDANTKVVEELGTKMAGVEEAIKEGTVQEAEIAKQQKEEPVVIEGIKENTDQISKNNTGLEQSGKDMRGLGEDMDKIATAMADGVGIDIGTTSEVVVDVKNVSEAAREFTDDFEAVAMRVAKAEIRIVLQQLAKASNNAEMAGTFESVV